MLDEKDEKDYSIQKDGTMRTLRNQSIYCSKCTE